MLMSIFQFHVHIGACFISMLLCCHLAQKAQKVLEEGADIPQRSLEARRRRDFKEVLRSAS